MSGALVGGVVALVGWLGLWVYLQVLNARFQRALTELEAERELPAPTVTVTEVGRG